MHAYNLYPPMSVYVDSSCLLFYVHDLNFARRENISPFKAVFFSNVVKTRRLQRHLVRLLERGVNPFISGEERKKIEKALQLQTKRAIFLKSDSPLPVTKRLL